MEYTLQETKEAWPIEENTFGEMKYCRDNIQDSWVRPR